MPWQLKASWGVGGLGTTSMLYLINMFVVYFLVRYIGIPAAIAGMLFAVTRVFDALINPVIGTWSDRSTGRWGRRRPWMLAGTLLAPIACIAVFNPPSLEPGPGLYAFVLATLLLYSTGYSLFAITHVAQGAEMTDDYKDRASLMAWRTFFIYVSGIVITAGAPALIAHWGSDRGAYSGMSIVAAGVIGATMLWVVAFTGGVTAPRPSTTRTERSASLLTTLENKPFVAILLTKMMGQLGTAFSGASMLFFLTDVMQRDEKAMALLGLVANLVGVASVPVWSRVLRGVERKALLLTLLAASAVTHFSWIFATPDESQLVFIIRAMALGSLGAGTVFAAMAMLTDTIEFDRHTTGERREGLFVGAYELMQTTSFVVAPLIAGFAFSIAGLEPGEAAQGHQPESAVQMIRLYMGVAPAICAALGVGLLTFYHLDAKKLAALRDSGADA